MISWLLLFLLSVFGDAVHSHEALDIFKQLSTYELIDWSQFRTTRDSNDLLVRHTSFATRNRLWHLVLKPERTYFSENSSVLLWDDNGPRRLEVDLHSLMPYTGHVAGEVESAVSAVINEYSNELCVRILINSDAYFIEVPAGFLLSTELQPLSVYTNDRRNRSVLFYRLRDYRIMEHPIGLNSTFADVEDTVDSSNPQTQNTLRRAQRSPAFDDKMLCSLTFIVDYLFFKNVGEEDVPKTTRIIVTLFHRLNALFRSAKFLVDETVERSGYGFLLGDIIIHETWSAQLGHYNAPADIGGKPWTPYGLSTAFNKAVFNETCLAHLLTYRPFVGILGRAWMAAPELGGICSPLGGSNGQNFHANTGWTTYMDYSGRRLLNAMAELITAHELGHNWGAAHDPDTDECSPPALSRGKYLMYAHSVAGFADNNYKFSPCSLRTIGATLAVRASLCFVNSTEAILSRCGNRRLDPDEECDAGTATDNPCCTSKCKLRPGAQCSPWNHDCCTPDCRIAPSATICAEPNSGSPCLGIGQCDGQSPICPGPALLSGVPCPEHGQCEEGRCKPQCARHNLRTCICDAAEESCFICCLFPMPNSSSLNCRPLTLNYSDSSFDHADGRFSYVSLPAPTLSNVVSSNEENKHVSINNSVPRAVGNDSLRVWLHLLDHRPCAMGYCVRGKCNESRENVIYRFWAYYKESNENPFVTFLRDNLILAVLSLSILFWIPGTLGIRRLRRRYRSSEPVT
ncbi:unnamed protein product [Calicophoron daubneyi]|uniref:Uncharacterized protein n=1 Tax=Calicophoron daubneyi TaxID=300641 RepID=A0AAV2TLZ3_CALDB